MYIHRIRTRLPKCSNDRQTNMSKALNSFQFIKTNRPVGNVKVYKTPVNELPCCDCDPKGAKPCGTNDCVNRALKYECINLFLNFSQNINIKVVKLNYMQLCYLIYLQTK